MVSIPGYIERCKVSIILAPPVMYADRQGLIATTGPGRAEAVPLGACGARPVIAKDVHAVGKIFHDAPRGEL